MCPMVQVLSEVRLESSAKTNMNINYFCSGLTMCCPMHFILYGFKEVLRGFVIGIVIYAAYTSNTFRQNTFSEEQMFLIRIVILQSNPIHLLV